MQADRWLKIEEIFADALPLNSAERETFLQDSCGTDGDLLQEIRDLLTAHEQPTSLLNNPIFDLGVLLLEGSTPPDRRGEILGDRFELRQVIGRGGMGEVYAAYDRERDEMVALKLISPAFALDNEHIARFHKEARAASLVSHANVAAIREIAHINGENIMAMDLVEGRNLRQHMADITDVEEILNIAIGVSRALVAAHSAGVVHRDIKPENIMVEADGNVKVLDFGLAKLVEPFVVDGVSSQMNGNARVTVALSTEIGMLMGTTNYMSPEQIRGEEIDTQTDIWSLGVVLYELLVGSCPFQGRTKIDVIASILTAEPTKLPRHFAASKATNALLDRALQKDKALRYQAAGEMLADLESVRAEVVRDSQEVASRVLGIPRWGWLTIGAAVVLLVGLLGVLPSTRAAIRNYFIPRSRAPISALPPVNDGLVAYWPGDGTAEDLVGGNDGTLLNGAGYRPGVKGQAFSFDGVDDLMDAAAVGLPTGAAPRTITMWAYIDEYRGRVANIGRWGVGPSPATMFGVAITGRFAAVKGSLAYEAPDDLIHEGRWYHVAATVADQSMSFYLDGKLMSTAPITLDTPWGSRFVAGGAFDGREFLTGAVDEICVYDRALSSDEIATLYNSLAPTHPSDPLHMTGMVSYWPADGDGKDQGPGKNDFELVNGATFSDGIRGQAFHFDGVDDLAQATTHKFPSGDGDRSLVLWFRADDFVANEGVFADYGALGEVTAVYGLGLNYRSPFFSNWGDLAAQDDSAPPVEPGRWYHLAASTSKGETSLYLDGKVIAKTNMKLNTTADTTLYLGTLPGIHARGRKLKGALDEISIYNRALSADEINFLYSNQR